MDMYGFRLVSNFTKNCSMQNTGRFLRGCNRLNLYLFSNYVTFVMFTQLNHQIQHISTDFEPRLRSSKSHTFQILSDLLSL
jgi:hypothetical protein